MPTWLVPLLKWGGIALAVVFAITLIWVRAAASAEGGASAPTALYWIVIGVVAAVAGFVLDRGTPKAVAFSQASGPRAVPSNKK